MNKTEKKLIEEIAWNKKQYKKCTESIEEAKKDINVSEEDYINMLRLRSFYWTRIEVLEEVLKK